MENYRCKDKRIRGYKEVWSDTLCEIHVPVYRECEEKHE